MAGKKNCGRCNKPKSVCNCGRPTLMTPETIQLLEAAFKRDMTDLEACLNAGISKSTLYNYQQEHPEFVERKEALKQALSLKAKNTIAVLVERDDPDTTKWWLERRRKAEFSTRTENTGKDGKELNPDRFNVTFTTDEEAMAAYNKLLKGEE